MVKEKEERKKKEIYRVKNFNLDEKKMRKINKKRETG